MAEESPRPNILLVVLDCVRAWDFPGGPDGVQGLPNFERLRRESWEFEKASSVAHWTVPSHASIFTGLYPWQHGVHAKGALAVPDRIPQIDRRLRDAGYATLSLSANGLISPALGFARDADRAAWGVSLFNRVSAKRTPPQSSGAAARRSALVESYVREQLKPLSYWAAVYLARYPGFWDLGTRVAHRVRPGDPDLPPRLAPWLEPTVERSLREVPKEKPLYCFVNLLDAHEPYLSEEGGAWWAYARTRQDRRGWVSGEWVPSGDEFERLHELYRGTLRLMDQRLGRIRAAFEAAGRWENTLVILTSDHGQAFGENGALFHINRIDEPELRVPLLVRPPGGRGAGSRAQGWASLIDIAPTVLRTAGIEVPTGELPGVPLMDLIDSPRPSPVFALNDGLVHAPDAASAPQDRRRELDRFLVGVYLDDRKLVLDPVTGETHAFNVDRDRFEREDLWEAERADFAPLADLAGEVGREVLGGPGASLGADVEDRLRSWGYI
jgi:arylsulfatase A-like enzyme